MIRVHAVQDIKMQLKILVSLYIFAKSRIAQQYASWKSIIV